MTPTLHRWSALAIATAWLAACSTPEAPKAPPPPKPIAQPGQRIVTVSDQNNGANVTVEMGQTLIVRLSTPGNGPLEWSLVDLAPGVFATTGPRFERALRNTNVEQSEGFTIWNLTPQAAGTVKLNFALRKPRNLDPAVQTVSYDVVVK